jgi:hypothetical protein
MLQGLVPIKLSALAQWERVDFRVDVKPSAKSVQDQNGVVVSVAYQKPYLFTMPDKIPAVALLPPPHCGVCNRPVSKIQVICTPDGASIAVSCHGYNTGKFLSIESLMAQGADGIYLQMLFAFSNIGGFQKAEDYQDWKAKQFDAWKAMDEPKVNFEVNDMRDLFRVMQDQEALKKYAGPIYSDTSSISTPYAPDCCLCKKPVRVTSREDYSMRRHIVGFECHGRREELAVNEEELLYRGIELGRFIAKCRPFLSDLKKLEGTEEPLKQKPKPRTGLTITIGQERVINLE